MSQLSDDESSDSSCDFLVKPEKLDLNSSFFQQSVSQPNPKEYAENNSDSESDAEYFEENISSADLLAQVYKNFENATKQNTSSNSTNLDSFATEIPATTVSGTISKSKRLTNEINDLLLQGETGVSSWDFSRNKNEDNEDEEEDAKEKYTIPKEGVTITVPGDISNLMFNAKRKKQIDLQTQLKNRINQRVRATQVLVHKVSLLLWLQHGFYFNHQANDPELLCICLSLVSPSSYPKGRADLKYLEQFTKWFKGQFIIKEENKDVTITKDILLERLRKKEIFNYIELVLLYIATLRGLGINCRLVINLRPAHLKPRQDQLFQLETKDEDKKQKAKPEECTEKSSKSAACKTKKDSKKNVSKKRTSPEKNSSSETNSSPEKIQPKNTREALRNAAVEAKKKAAAIFNSSNSSPKKSSSQSPIACRTRQTQPYINEEVKTNMSIASKIRIKLCKPDSKDESKVKPSTSKVVKKTSKQSTRILRGKETSGSLYFADEFEHSDEDFEIKKPPKKKVKACEPKVTKPDSSDKRRKLLSTDDETNSDKKTWNVWAEVYLESEESWISVSVLDGKIHCVSEIYKKATSPVTYVIAWNSSGTLKDVTRRYCPHWLTDTRKKRVDNKWWSETLSYWKETESCMSKAENEMLLQRELEQPLPKTVGECKGHPLYALTRHLLKYEALYPPDAVPLGHLKTGEAIYSRFCVHTLYSRETWVKRARVVKPGETCYKVVKALPKYDKLSGTKIKDLPLELFGKWQTMPYVPPEAKDGIVPRNEYGNVDLFQMCMLPKGTVHINLPGLNRVARKLNIDCAPAVVGFNFGGRGALPAFEGFVACEEFEDTLREAWEQEQREARKRAKEKYEKRIYGNWKKLIKGLFIRERLAAKYDFADEDANTAPAAEATVLKKRKGKADKEKATKKLKTP